MEYALRIASAPNAWVAAHAALAPERVLPTMARDAERWRAQGAPDLRLAVDLPARALADPLRCEPLERVIRALGLARGQLELVAQPPLGPPGAALIARMRALRALGVRIMLAGFGEEDPSIARVRSLPLDGIQLGRALHGDVARDPSARAVVAGLLQIIRGLGLTAVADGVEDRAQAETLRRLGCHELQGPLFGARAGADAVLARLRDCSAIAAFGHGPPAPRAGA